MQQERKREQDMPGETLNARKERARVWFEQLRDEICGVLEAIDRGHATADRRRAADPR